MAFGKSLVEQGTVLADIVRSCVEIEQARLLVLKAAHLMDMAGNKVGGQGASQRIGPGGIYSGNLQTLEKELGFLTLITSLQFCLVLFGQHFKDGKGTLK